GHTAVAEPAALSTPDVQAEAATTINAAEIDENAAPRTRREARESFLTQTKPQNQPATQGWRGALVRMGSRMPSSAGKKKERDDVQAVSQHWPGPRTVGVVKGTGGVGKTPTTI